MSSLKKTCDFCASRKRSCDGLARRRCSACIATKQPVCHYRPRRPWRAHPSKHNDDAAMALSLSLHPGGKSFCRTDDEGGRTTTPAGTGSGDELVLLPRERGRFSASPATGLIGFQENGFLGDFFGCFGFLSLTSESTVRGAMVGVMLAGASMQHQHHPGAVAPLPHSSPGLAGGYAGGVRRAAVGESSSTTGDSGWSSALATENGSEGLPRDPSTCVLWCAIALGALVQGLPLNHVSRYVELAQDSLLASHGGATLGMARAYVAMAFLHNFLGDQVKSHEYVQLTNGIVEALSPEEIPRGFRDLLLYAGYAWMIETELASADDMKRYFENLPPIWQLPESVMERDICGLVLSVNVQVNSPFVDETGTDRAPFVMQQNPSAVSPVMATRPPIDDTPGLPAVEEVDRVCLGNVEARAEIQIKSVLPELLRLEEIFMSSDMHLGVGGLLYYGNLSYLQILTRQPMSMTSSERCLHAVLRYPGLCRHNTWLHFVHALLFFFAKSPERRDYDALRASYNSARPDGCLPAPPFEKWRDIADICDHAACRRVTKLVRPLLLDSYTEAPTTHDLAPDFLS